MHRVNIKPLSSNAAWKGKRYASDKYNQYKKDLAWLLPKSIELPDPPYQIHFKWGFSNVSSDWDNPIKPTQDCIAAKYKFNDKLIKRGIVDIEYVEKGAEYFEFSITHFTG